MVDVSPTIADIGTILPKSATGIEGLDDVLHGGFPRGRTTLIGGGPGTGKTVLALEFLYRGALNGEPGILISFEEQAEAIRRNAGTMGWHLEALERTDKLILMHADVPPGLVQSGEFDIGGLLGILGGQVRTLSAQRIVIDGVDMLLRLFRDSRREEDQLVTLHNWLLAQNLTALLTVKTSGEGFDPVQRLEYLTDCVLRLDHRVVGQVSTRRLRVLKYRGSGFLSNEYPYVITPGGIVLMPISNAALSSTALGSRLPTGVSGLDRLLDGGLLRGSSIVIGGGSGTGKTLLGCSLAAAASAHGERVLYISFEESVESLASAVRSAGIDLYAGIESGDLHVLTAIPESMGVEEHLWRIFQAIKSFDPQHLIVDAISACQRMGSEAAAFDFLVRLLTHCRTRGITCIYLNQTDPEHGPQQITGVGISSLTDALLVLDQDWPDDTHRRRMLIVKVRGSRYAHSWNPFRITDTGLVFGDSLDAPCGRGKMR
jgi:circadian clock protein KaiC